MNTKAVRLYGKMDLRLEDMTLPEVGQIGRASCRERV